MLLYPIKYFWDRKIVPGFKIKKNDLVLDIGSGDKPFWRGNVFLDNLELKNLHRHTDTQTIKDLGLFVNGDITKTKFKNKAFDFSFCTHLLEHVDRPDLAIKEITRISKKGYIEVPNGIIEFISPFHSHIWFILFDGKKLTFVRKGKKLHESLLRNAVNYQNIIPNLKNPFIRLYWKNKIEYEIIDLEKESDKYFPPETTPKTNKNKSLLILSTYFYMTLVKILRIIYSVNNKVELKKISK